MRRICCVCGIVLGEKEPLDDPSETHTVCERHERELLAELQAGSVAFKVNHEHEL